MSKHHYTYLALGDSYTIGESVPLHDSFPYQTVQLLRKAGLTFQAPEIVAKTGWTSFELTEHILRTSLNEPYDFVTLLIGVNNQYRNLSVEDFSGEFDFLLKKAIHFSGDRPDRVMVLSIPDWGVTPFAKKLLCGNISREIDMFNSICSSAAKAHQAQFIDITAETRKVKNDSSLLADDLLHYTGKEYRIWAEKIAHLCETL